MRASGLSLVTDAARRAFVAESWSQITALRAKGWDALSPRFREMFTRYGIGEAEWDKLRASPLKDMGGAPWILPESVADAGLADRVAEMIYSEMDMAVIMPIARVQAAMNSMPKRGTVIGEVGRLLFQFKTFPVTALYLHGSRMLAQKGFNKAVYSAGFLGLTAVAGYASLQSKEVSKGREPKPMSAETLFASIAQGGGLGIYGDFLFASTNRFGKSASETVLGPSASTIDAVSGLVTGAPLLAAEGEETDYDKQLVRMLRSETPGVGSLWYARLAYDRLILDQWQQEADPRYMQSWNMLERRAVDRGQDYWWGPGMTSPDGAPNLANAWEGEVPE